MAAWQQESGELQRKLSLLEQQTPRRQADDGQGGGAGSVEETMRRATEAEFEKALLERQVCDDVYDDVTYVQLRLSLKRRCSKGRSACVCVCVCVCVLCVCVCVCARACVRVVYSIYIHTGRECV